jgi:glycosyltransferase involved in cell wall biosynthesis
VATDLYDLSLIVACYNEEPILHASMAQVFDVLDGTRLSYEVIFVDDMSQDRTRAVIDEIIARHPWRPLRRILHERNRGRGRTVADGFLVAQGAVAGYIDIDLEVEAHYIPVCVRAVQQGADVATALRTDRFRLRSLDRYVMSRGYAWLMRRLLHVPLVDTETGFKFFRRERLLPLLATVRADGWFWDTEVMVRAFRAGYRIVEIPCLYVRRFDKPSSVARWRDSVDYLRQLWRFRAESADDARAPREP